MKSGRGPIHRLALDPAEIYWKVLLSVLKPLTLMMCSITYAQRAEEVLAAAGYHIHIDHNPDPEGCRYLVRVSGGDPDEALHLLAEQGVKVRKVIREDEE